MLGIKHFKAEPTEFARMRVKGKSVKQGEGTSGFYLPFRTTLEVVPVVASDQPFVFHEICKDNQEVTLQGGFIYRISDPELAMGLYNFSIDPNTRQYLTEDSTKIPQHILQLVRGEAKSLIQTTSLEEVLVMGKSLATDITGKLTESPLIPGMGIEFRSLYFDTITPNPEIAKALEADYRETLLQKADVVIYERRAQAVENERKIREEEIKTETQMEERRKQLVELQGKNAIREAEDSAKAVEVEGKGRANVALLEGETQAKNIYAIGEAKADAAKKMIVAYEDADPMVIASQTLSEFGRHAKLGDINITPEVLSSLGTAIKYIASKK
jgi:regulator of protease activity HflC (stomatin/prohibitin superfamily)